MYQGTDFSRAEQVSTCVKGAGNAQFLAAAGVRAAPGVGAKRLKKDYTTLKML